MKKNIHFKRTFNYFIISLAALFSVFLFQAQDTIDENDPGYDTFFGAIHALSMFATTFQKNAMIIESLLIVQSR